VLLSLRESRLVMDVLKKLATCEEAGLPFSCVSIWSLQLESMWSFMSADFTGLPQIGQSTISGASYLRQLDHRHRHKLPLGVQDADEIRSMMAEIKKVDVHKLLTEAGRGAMWLRQGFFPVFGKEQHK
jgi:hypothetical protein